MEHGSHSQPGSLSLLAGARHPLASTTITGVGVTCPPTTGATNTAGVLGGTDTTKEKGSSRVGGGLVCLFW